MPDLLFQPTPHKEAVDFIAGKSVVSREVFNGLLPELKGRAFVVSKIEDANTVQQIRDLVAQLPAGADWATQKKQIAALASPFFMDPDADEETRVKQQAAAERKAELLLRTHGGQAYSAAAWRVAQRQKKVFPYWKYQSMGDGHVRESHAALNNIVLPADHEFWKEHYPPWQWGCRCLVVVLSKDDYEDELRADASKPEMERNILQGTRLKRLEEERKINRGPTQDIDLRSDGERGKKDGYSWHPGDVRLTAAQLKGRYAPEIWNEFESWAKKTKVTQRKTVWQWMDGEELEIPIEVESVSVQAQKSENAWPADVSKLKVQRSLGGSTGATLVSDPETGTQYVLKRGNSAEHLREEFAADQLYRSLGIDVPEAKLYETPAGPAKLARLIEGQNLREYLAKATPAQREAVLEKLRKGFAADALMGNWDVIGLAEDNILVDANGSPWRIDNGGSLRFRAQGKLKTAAEWNEFPVELWTLRDAVKNPVTAKVFGKSNIYEIADTIRQLDRAAFLDAAPEELRAVLSARFSHLQDLARKSVEYRSTQFTVKHAEGVTRQILGLRQAGVLDQLAAELHLPSDSATVPVDSLGRPGDDLRTTRTKVAPATPNDQFYQAILPGVTTVNGHHGLGNTQYNAGKLQTALNQKPALEKFLKSGTVEQKAIAKHYLETLDQIAAAQGDVTKKVPLFSKAPAAKATAAPKTGTVIEALAAYMQAQDADWTLVSKWGKAQGGSSKSAFSKGVKRWLMERMEGATANEFFDPPTAAHLTSLRKLYGDKLDTTFEIFHAFNQEVFAKMDFPGNDRENHFLRLIRVETTPAALLKSLSPGEKGQYQRGVNESGSLYTEFAGGSGAVTVTAVPHTRATSCYFYESTPGGGGDFLLGDSENEVTYIGWKLETFFAGVRTRVKRLPSKNRADWEI